MTDEEFAKTEQRIEELEQINSLNDQTISLILYTLGTLVQEVADLKKQLQGDGR